MSFMDFVVTPSLGVPTVLQLEIGVLKPTRLLSRRHRRCRPRLFGLIYFLLLHRPSLRRRVKRPAATDTGSTTACDLTLESSLCFRRERYRNLEKFHDQSQAVVL
jgi:hypothetical protein